MIPDVPDFLVEFTQRLILWGLILGIILSLIGLIIGGLITVIWNFWGYILKER